MRYKTYIISIAALAAFLSINQPACAFLHPQLGRFVQRDPIGYVDGDSLYQYLLTDPTNILDPSGAQMILLVPPTTVAPPGTLIFPPGTIIEPAPIMLPPDPGGPIPAPPPTPTPTPVPPLPAPPDQIQKPFYNPKDNPDADDPDPCDQYVKAYKNAEDKLADLNKKNGSKSTWSCAQWIDYYNITLEMARQRDLGDQCHQYHNLSDGRTGQATGDAYRAAKNAYDKIKEKCPPPPPSRTCPASRMDPRRTV